MAMSGLGKSQYSLTSQNAEMYPILIVRTGARTHALGCGRQGTAISGYRKQL